MRYIIIMGAILLTSSVFSGDQSDAFDDLNDQIFIDGSVGELFW